MSSEEENSIKDILDYKFASQYTNKDVKVELKKAKNKGISLFAKKPIKKGNIIAYYKFKVFKEKKFKGIKNNMYTISVYNKSRRSSNTFVGDLYGGSLEMPKRGISFLAYFSNEPSPDQEENCHLDENLKNNYKNREKVKEGDTMIYKLIADRNIKKGEEIMWCYSSSYNRKYRANCE